ncbi:MAG: hypothetical protein PHY26_00010 [Bacilli bacterium]|nr:hypothetical protein [Bacilli bacterium]
MSNFLKFIEEDITAKKTLLSTMPTKTKRDIKKYNEKITDMINKYNEYEGSVKKYLDTKSRSFNIKKKNNDSEKLSNQINSLEHVRFVLNPDNTYYEKMGFDSLLYQISNYYYFNFNCLNEIINNFLDKFELVGIKLTGNDFEYTCYVKEYMTSFLEVRYKKKSNYEEVAKIFEKIYWVNPEIIEHIELNFRKLIKKYEKEFNNYINELQKKVMLENRLNNYADCLEKLKKAYIKLRRSEREDICDIVDLAKNGEIEINNYFDESKFRTTAYSSLMIDSLNFDDKERMTNFYKKLEKLLINLEEYNNFLKFMPLFNDFKNEYEKQIPNSDKDLKREAVLKRLKELITKINNKEAKLEKLNKKIFSDGLGFFMFKNNNTIKELKSTSIKLAKELYELYKEYEQECFNDKVLSILTNSLTIPELLHLYYSYDYFKKKAIKKVFDVTTYDEVIKYSEEFDLFAMNPTNVIIKGVTVFEENNLARVIMNRYRLDNINVTEETLSSEELNVLIEKIKFLLRISEIENSATTVEKIWFMAQVEKFNALKNKEK